LISRRGIGIRRLVKAFWWFRENKIAGMARPGFNAVHWFDLPFDEAVLLGWLGKLSSESEAMESFRAHLAEYPPKIARFYGLSPQEGAEALRSFDTPEGIARILGRLVERSLILDDYRVTGESLHFTWGRSRLDAEIGFLKARRIRTVVSLTERHHHREILEENFECHHLAIDDLGAPRIDQVARLAEILGEARVRDEAVAVHCLAGIGRTSTMLMGAHLLMGESLEDLERLLKRQNPAFILTGAQRKFIETLR
jgi:hypothetical protein